MKKSAIVYWLVPAKDERELFGAIIHILGRQFKGPEFHPHVTLLIASQDWQAAGRVLGKIKAAPVRLRARKVAYSSKFTKTLFVRFEPSNSLDKLVADLCSATKSSVKSLREPHLSLIYKKMPARVKEELAATIRLPFREVVFDSIAAVCCRVPTRSRADVEAWQTVATKKLRRRTRA